MKKKRSINVICGKTDFESFEKYRAHRGGCAKKNKPKGLPRGGISPDTVSRMIDVRIAKVNEKIDALIAQLTQGQAGDDGEGEGADNAIKITEQELEIQKDLTINRQVLLLPHVFFYFNYTRAIAGKEIDFNEWVNAVIIEHFAECIGREPVMVVREPAVPKATMGTAMPAALQSQIQGAQGKVSDHG